MEKLSISVNNVPNYSANSASLDLLYLVALIKSFASSSASIQSFTDADFTNPNINIDDYFGAQHGNDMTTNATSHGDSIGLDHNNILCNNSFYLPNMPLSLSHGTTTSLSISKSRFLGHYITLTVWMKIQSIICHPKINFAPNLPQILSMLFVLMIFLDHLMMNFEFLAKNSDGADQLKR